MQLVFYFINFIRYIRSFNAVELAVLIILDDTIFLRFCTSVGNSICWVVASTVLRQRNNIETL